jgi:hypothetical protein
MASGGMWTSKLCNKYSMASIQQDDPATQKELKRLRALRSNSFCFDCGRQENSWSSVNHGVFICVVCSDVHRSVGTHITKTKGCTGTYLWGPDELAKVQSIGNQGGERLYGTEKVSPDASKECKQQHVIDKYEKRLFVSKSNSASKQANAVVQKAEQARQNPVSSGPCGLAITKPQKEIASRPSKAQEISRSLFDDFFDEAPETHLHLVEEVVVAKLDSATKNHVCQMARQPMAIASRPPKAQTISQSLFDDLFNEASETHLHLVDEVVVAKPGDSATKNPYGQENNSLDDFLNATLIAETNPMTTENSSLRTSVAVNDVTEPIPFAEDPFFDWAF